MASDLEQSESSIISRAVYDEENGQFGKDADDDERVGLLRGSSPHIPETSINAGSAENFAVDWSECVVLTLDMFNSFTLLLGTLLFACGLYIRHMWNQGLSGQGIVFTFLLIVAFFLGVVACSGFVAVRLSRQPSLAKGWQKVTVVLYAVFLLMSIVAQLMLGGMMSVFLDSMVDRKHRLHPQAITKQERSISFTKELQYDYEVWSNCTYTRCCKWKKYAFVPVPCVATKDHIDQTATKLIDMCHGWPATKIICRAGVERFQQRSALLMEGYFQPMLVFIVTNAFLQLLVLVFASLELMTTLSARARARRMQLNQ